MYTQSKLLTLAVAFGMVIAPASYSIQDTQDQNLEEVVSQDEEKELAKKEEEEKAKPQISQEVANALAGVDNYSTAIEGDLPSLQTQTGTVFQAPQQDLSNANNGILAVEAGQEKANDKGYVSESGNRKPAKESEVAARGGENTQVQSELEDGGANVDGNAEQNGIAKSDMERANVNAANQADSIIVTADLPVGYRDEQGSLAQNHNEGPTTEYFFNQGGKRLPSRDDLPRSEMLARAPEFQVSPSAPLTVDVFNVTIPNEGQHNVGIRALTADGTPIADVVAPQVIRAWSKPEGLDAADSTAGPSTQLVLSRAAAQPFLQQDAINGLSGFFEVFCTIHGPLTFTMKVTDDTQQALTGQGDAIIKGGGHEAKIRREYQKMSPAHLMVNFINRLAERMGSWI